MNTIGKFLKQARSERGLSLQAVHQQCGITDSKLSKYEREKGRSPSPGELKKLANLYGISVISLYLMAGYLDESDLISYQLVFNNAELLKPEEVANIQTQINLLTKGRQVSDNDF